MMRGLLALVLVSLAAPTTAAAADAQHPTWRLYAGWELSKLGRPRPLGFGESGGSTARVDLERALWGPTSTRTYAIASARGYGFEAQSPRSIGMEVDIGLRVSRHLTAWPIAVGVMLSGGVGRVPLETALGTMRFLVLRPAAEAQVSYTWDPGMALAAHAGCRVYHTIVWTGCAWSAGASAGWVW